MTIYLDVLVLLNLFVTFFLFKAAARMMNVSPNRWRMLAGTLLGGVYSLLILFDLTRAELVICKLLMGVSLVLTVFFRREGGFRSLLRAGLYFFLVNFLFAGFMQALWLFAAPAGMAYRNGVAYFNISALTLAVSTIAAYLVITLFCRILNRRTGKRELIDVTVSFWGREAAVTGFADTGNKLCDIFTGLPVVVCEYEALREIFPERIRDFFRAPAEFAFGRIEDSSLKTALRVIPINGAGGASSLPAFRPDRITVDGIPRQAVVAVTVHPLSDGVFRALVHPSLCGK